jgi:hypothetical protein
MAEVTLQLDDALLAAAALVLGTHGPADTVRAALEAASRVGGPRPQTPGRYTRPGRELPPLGDPPLGPPKTPGHTDFPHPPEIH